MIRNSLIYVAHFLQSPEILRISLWSWNEPVIFNESWHEQSRNFRWGTSSMSAFRGYVSARREHPRQRSTHWWDRRAAGSEAVCHWWCEACSLLLLSDPAVLHSVELLSKNTPRVPNNLNLRFIMVWFCKYLISLYFPNCLTKQWIKQMLIILCTHKQKLPAILPYLFFI